MKALVLGGTGATGKCVIKELIKKNIEVLTIVRSVGRLPEEILNNDLLTVIEDSIDNIGVNKASDYITGCDAVVSCLGHNLTFKGIYGKPLKLVTNATKVCCSAIESNNSDKPIKFILMNTTGNKNIDLKEHRSIGEKLVIGLVRLLIPPQRDNECAANYLRTNIGQSNRYIEWSAVRPDTLVDSEETSDYEIHESPIRSAIFNPGKTSRINVANFMSELITDDTLWSKWKGQMPVIYNKDI